jgi:hypothetical protein
MVNKCELSANRRHLQQAKDADRLGPKWCAIGTGTQAFPVVDDGNTIAMAELASFSLC